MPLAVGLSDDGKLYWGPQQIATASVVTSFAVRLHSDAAAVPWPRTWLPVSRPQPRVNGAVLLQTADFRVSSCSAGLLAAMLVSCALGLDLLADQI